MGFDEIIAYLKNSFNLLVNDYDGIIVKRLEESNTLEEDRATHQTHIAITGEQMDFFPCLMANNYFNCNYELKNEQLKKYFVARVPIKIFKENVIQLSADNDVSPFHFDEATSELLNVCVVRSRRKDQADQMQLSLLSSDDEDFVLFRRLLSTRDFLIILKVKNKLEYECLGVKASSATELVQLLDRFNNRLVLSNNSLTVVDTEKIIVEKNDFDLDIEQISLILANMYNNAEENYKVAAIHMFGIKFGNLILEKQFRIRDIISIANLSQSYETELSKGLNIYKCLENNRYGVNIEHIANLLNDQDRVKGGYNMIYYGTPGCGKSYLVNNKYNKSEYDVIRTTFYPDYSNSDFVGQIIPKIDDEHNVYYEFQEGPFSIALLAALKNPEKKVCLVIEEINRGNASAIFGDIFQLLDRDEEGNSIYRINNYAITKYLIANGVLTDDKVYIPSNLWIIGTMNTCDQNVYILDTAFKRRWKMNKISNKFESGNKLANMYIPGSNYTWKEFVEKINKAILENNPGGLNGEDKQLGVYFVTENELIVNKTDDYSKASEYFAEKVLMYIWEDIAKIDPTLWFSSDFKSFDELLEEFNKKRLNIFKDLFEEDNKGNEEILGEE